MDLKYLFLVVTTLHGVHGLRCLSCQGVIEPRACLHKQECGVGEICYTEQVIDDDLTKYYNVGCRSTQLCDMAKIAFGRRSGELQVCQKCCHTDKCNNQECQNSQGASTNICSKCQDVASPLECQSVVECRSDEICFSQQFVNDNFKKRYNLGCEKKKRCELLRQLAPYHRNLQLCNKCCQGSECNKKLCIAQLPTKAPQIITIITTKATATTLPITAATRSSPTTTTSLTTTTFPTETTSATHASTKLTNTQASLQARSPRTCHICGDTSSSVPCNSRQIYIDVSHTCKTGENYCMTDIVQDDQGNVDVFKRCVDLATCEKKWLIETSDMDYCTYYGVVKNPNAFSCHFCCTENKCNSMLVPNTTTLYTYTN